MDKNMLVSVVLGVLVVISLVQAYQLTTLKSTGSAISTATVSTPVTQSGGNNQPAKLPANLENLPSMVGGC